MLWTLRSHTRGAIGVRLATLAVSVLLAASLTSRSGEAAVERVVLDNGLTVIAKQDTSSDIAGVQVLVGAGQEHEERDRSGIRTLIGEMLLMGMREKLTVDDELDTLRQQQNAAPERAIFNAGTHWGFAELEGAVATEALPDCLRFLASIAFEDALTQEQLVIARDVLGATRSRGLERDPVRQTYQLLRKALTGRREATVSLLGTEESLKAISLDDAVEFRNRTYVASNMCIGIVSPLRPRDAVALARDVFERFPAGDRLGKAPLLPADAGDAEVEGSSDLLRLAQPRIPPPASLMLGVPVPSPGSPDAVVGEVIRALLGRPNGILARDQKLTQALGPLVRPSLSPWQTLVIPAGSVAPHMTIHAFCHPYNIEDAKAMLLAHLAKLRTEEVDGADLDEAKAFAINQSAREHETKVDQAELLAKWELLGSGYDYDERFAGLVADVTAKDVQRVAQTYFRRPAVAVQMPVTPS